MESIRAVKGDLDFRSVRALIDPFFANGSAPHDLSRLVLDLTEVVFATPSSIVTLAAILDGQSPSALPLTLVLPTNVDCRRYLASAGFSQHVSRSIEVIGNDFGGIGPSDVNSILPLTCLGEEDDIAGVCHKVETRIDEMLGCGDEPWARTKGAIIGTIREICANVFHHAGGAPGWIAAQRYTNRKTNTRYVEIGISDAGQGVRSTLAPVYPELANATDGEALKRMVRDRLSRRPEGGSGYSVLQEATRQLDGSFNLRSGSGILDRPRRGGLREHNLLPAWTGTHLAVRLTCA